MASLTSAVDENPDVYEDRFNTIVYNGVVALGIGLGQRVGLFKALTDLSGPHTSQRIADNAGLHERYVREWLFSMVAAKVVFVTEDNKYFIPAECKTKTSKSLYATMLPAIAPLTKDVEKCFRSKDPSSAGYDFSKLGEAFDFMNKDGDSYDGKWLEDNLLPAKYKSKDLFLFTSASVLLSDKIKTILDIGCGVGKLTASIANYFPDAKVVGIDVDHYAIETAIKLKEDKHLTNVEFYLLGADNLKKEWTKGFDWIIMFRVFHDLPNPDPCLRESIRVMKDDGVMTFLDNLGHSNSKLNVGNKPLAATLMVSCYMCLPCSLSAPPAVGNGIGWGLENRATYIRENGLIIHDNELVECIHCYKATL
ncbi:S-adenosylmethionine-dependent methyltransferase Rv2258c-like [Mytilus trossulus]|uniref:S-adenosylmethionine-dependent methyltransferase Rv2258c-like n=1 Tax=Mytilus trossulus TaxID=6551 RepID=UPI003007E1CD